MDKNEAVNLVKKFSTALLDDYEPLQVVLYGSYARGSQTDTSDIDVAVIVKAINGDFLDQEAGLYKIRRNIDIRIEPVLLEYEHDPSGFLESVLRDGLLIYNSSDSHS